MEAPRNKCLVGCRGIGRDLCVLVLVFFLFLAEKLARIWRAFHSLNQRMISLMSVAFLGSQLGNKEVQASDKADVFVFIFLIDKINKHYLRI